MPPLVPLDTFTVFDPLLPPARDKAAYGGRGSGKSHFFASLMIEDAATHPGEHGGEGLRAVCIREVQKDLAQSSKALIEAKLAEFGIGEADGFKAYRECIRLPGDGIIIFKGMQDATADSIKSGINISEGCPASGINDAIRTLMAQVATWLGGSNAPLPKSGGTLTGAVTNLGNGSTLIDGGGVARSIGYRAIPLASKSASYQISLNDVGQGLSTSAGIAVPPNATIAFAVGDTIAVYNNSASPITITQGSGVTLRLAGTTTIGSRALAARGLCTLLKVGTDEWVASGGGLS